MSSFFNGRTTGQCLQLALRANGIARIPGFLQEDLRIRLLEVFLEKVGSRNPGFILARPSRASAKTHLFWTVARELGAHLSQELQESGGFPFSSRNLRFNHIVGQRYLSGKQLGSHRDHCSFIDLVAILVLQGQDGLYMCDDEYGTNGREVENASGDLLLMPAPGFYGSDFRPWHFVKNGAIPRITLGFRHLKGRSR